MKDSDFQLLVTSVKQAGEIKRGKMQPAAKIEVRPEDVKAIRSKLRKSQSEFALMIGVSVSTLQNWEQGRRQPEGPARALLRVASINPSAVAAALDAATSWSGGKPIGSVHPPKSRGKLASDIVIEDRR
jgi:putative transcriptional regulator